MNKYRDLVIWHLMRTTICIGVLFAFSSIALAQEKERYVKERLGDNVNSIYSDMSPCISPDGKTLYFITDGAPENIGVIAGYHDDDQDIYYSEKQADGSWGKRIHFPPPINNKGYNRVVSCSPDNNTLIVKNVYDKDGQPAGEGISVSYRTASGWTVPKEIMVKNFVNKSDHSGSCLSSDGKILISSIETETSEGDQDLYVSFLGDDGSFSEPKNMGKTLNTKKTEMAPFIASDGKTLYFASDGHGGFGSKDIFYSKRLDESWVKWSEPVNLGPDVNTPDWDSYFVLSASGDYAYMVSYTEGTKEDIYRVRLKESAKPEPVILVAGKVLDCKTKLPLETIVSYRDLATDRELGTARSDPNGIYKIILPSGKKYSFSAKKEQYYGINNNIDATNNTEYKEITQDLLLCPVEVGGTILLNNIFFEFAKAALKPESFPELDHVVEFLNTSPSITIRISGHTDNVGSEANNQKLSQARAESVVAYLTSKGVAASRLEGKGYGKSKPIATNDSEEGRAQNRRVEFTILKK